LIVDNDRLDEAVDRIAIHVVGEVGADQFDPTAVRCSIFVKMFAGRDEMVKAPLRGGGHVDAPEITAGEKTHYSIP